MTLIRPLMHDLIIIFVAIVDFGIIFEVILFTGRSGGLVGRSHGDRVELSINV